ncbi:hypothetical protein BS78_08G002100 [Paspalum vaginatum]|nr:hypothetical protein BS78_08G002100 [Paspalum vaginatum]
MSGAATDEEEEVPCYDDDDDDYTMRNRGVSRHVVDLLGLQVGPQDRLLAAASGGGGGDRHRNRFLMPSAVIRHLRGPAFLGSCRFAYDHYGDKVYVLMPTAEDVDLLCARGKVFDVGRREHVAFYKVKRVRLRDESVDDSANLGVRRVA